MSKPWPGALQCAFGARATCAIRSLWPVALGLLISHCLGEEVIHALFFADMAHSFVEPEDYDDGLWPLCQAAIRIVPISLRIDGTWDVSRRI